MKSERSDGAHGFWKALEKTVGRLKGQGNWKSADITQWTSILNGTGDRIAISIERSDVIWLNVSGDVNEQGEDYATRIQMFSRMILEKMSDQDLGGRDWSLHDKDEHHLNKFIVDQSKNGRSIKVRLLWERDNESCWTETAFWVKKQFDRLYGIINCTCGENNGDQREM